MVEVRSRYLARSTSCVAIPTEDLGGVRKLVLLGFEAVVHLPGAACRASIVFRPGPAARVRFRLFLGYLVTAYSKLTLLEPEPFLSWLCLL
jgi:hypothetical protein